MNTRRRSAAVWRRRASISLTDMVKRFGDETVLYGWLRNGWLRSRNTLEFLGIWEQIYNPDFNPLEFERFRSEAGLNSFSLSPSKWGQSTGAFGIYAKAGRGGGTYAHRDIAFEFGSWLSPEFKLCLIKEFQRLKDDEAHRVSREWSFQRTLAKVNYRIHTDAIQEHLIPPELTKAQIQFAYASEADLLNAALFGRTAAEWRKENARFGRPFVYNVLDVADLDRVGVLVVSLKDSWLDTTSGMVRQIPMGIFSTMAEHERERHKQRVRAGMDRARTEGRHMGRPRRSPVALYAARDDVRRGVSVRQAALARGIPQSTLRDFLRRSRAMASQ